MIDKKCSVCGGIFPATTEYFYKHRASLHAKCKICYNKYQLEKQSTLEYKAKRLERLTSQREHINRRQRSYYASNPKKWNEYYRKWSKNNPDVALAAVHRRRAKKLSNGTEKYTRKDMLDTYGFDCYLCGLPIDLSISGKVGSPNWEKGLHIEHIIPITRGGPDTLENVRPSHGKCNLNKGTK